LLAGAVIGRGVRSRFFASNGGRPDGDAEGADVSVLAGGRVVIPGRVLDPGWVEVDGDRLAAVGEGTPARAADVDLRGRVVVPGFVDLHVHGGGGGSFTTGDVHEAARVVDFHRRHGTTTTMASLVTAELAELEGLVAALADLVADGLLAGVHLEGPWLSARQRGAHDPALLRAPAGPEVERLLQRGRGSVRMVTLAPELDGGLAAVSRIVAAGAVAALGHTHATYAVTREALDTGATLGTHLFNAMRPVHHREPGPAVALLDDPRATVEVIADGVHVHPAMLRRAVTTKGAERVALVTDAMAAAGMADGDYQLGGLHVGVVDGVARLADGGALAGSTLTMDAAFRGAVRGSGLPLEEVARLASTTPAAVLGLPLHVTAVMAAGAWVQDAGSRQDSTSEAARG
jgi:N-acetylglucosamine-6-phosphate deacetylase